MGENDKNMKGRKIKVRYIWSAGTQLFRYDFEIEQIEGGISMHIGNVIARLEGTGLMDSQGLEIFEGDILSFAGVVGHVVWDGFNFQLTQDPPGQDESLGYKKSYGRNWSLHEMYLQDFNEEKPTYKILGNIYENPELLNQQPT